MSDVEWDADDFEPVKAAPPAPTDKWDGEDEEDEIKDNWDDEEGSEGKEASTTTVPVLKKKKKLADKIAEKEARRQEELERRRKEKDEKEKSLSPEQKLEEKLRLQKEQEEADLQLATELMGTTTTSSTAEEDDKLLDDIDLSERDGLESFKKALVSKIRSTDRLEKRPFFVSFVEDLSRELCQNLELDELKRVSTVLNSLYNEKVKASKPKNKKKSANKSKLNVGQGAIIDDLGNDFGAEYDDFM